MTEHDNLFLAPSTNETNATDGAYASAKPALAVIKQATEYRSGKSTLAGDTAALTNEKSPGVLDGNESEDSAMLESPLSAKHGSEAGPP